MPLSWFSGCERKHQCFWYVKNVRKLFPCSWLLLLDVVSPVILSQYCLEAWLSFPWDAKLLKGAPQAGVDCNGQSAKLLQRLTCLHPFAPYLHWLGNCPLEITGWLVGLLPTFCSNKGLSEKLSTAFALENRCFSTGQGIIRLDHIGYHSFSFLFF